MELHLEHRVGCEFPPRHAVCAWLLEHSAAILNIRIRGTDGKTPWQRIKGRNFGMRISGFGEVSMFKKDMKGPSKAERGNVASNFEHGVYIGFDRRSCAHKYVDDSGLTSTSRQPMRAPDPE